MGDDTTNPAPAGGSDLTGVSAERLRELAKGTLVERMGIELAAVSPERAHGSMPVTGNTQPYGLLHGGASAVLAETLGSLAAAAHAGSERIAVGVELNCTHHRAARTGHVHGVATALHRGNSLASYEIVITDDDGARICTARLTCVVRAAPPGA